MVDFVIGGAQKAGTRALASFLARHPAIVMARRTEPHYFDREQHFTVANAEAALLTYRRQFAPAEPGILLGDSTPDYMFWATAPARVHAYNPAMKWILVLRDPVSRAYSAWNMERERGTETLTFEDALDAEIPRCVAESPFMHRRFSYLERGRYSWQIQRLWRMFGQDRVLILRTEALRDAHAQSIDAVCSFLGIERGIEIPAARVHEREYPAPMHPDTEARLRHAFSGEVLTLEHMLGWNLSSWRTPG